jgi:hypothetical protein
MANDGFASGASPTASASPANPRLLFCSNHCYLDPSSGAALATRDLLELLAARGWACGALSGPRLDFETRPTLESLLQAHGLPFDARAAPSDGAPFRLFHLPVRGVPVTLYEPAAQPPGRPPAPHDGRHFLPVLDGVLDRFRPDVLLTYGGDDLAREVMGRARRRNGWRRASRHSSGEQRRAVGPAQLALNQAKSPCFVG